MADIVIYGGGFQAVAAAAKAAAQSSNAQIVVIVPYPVSNTAKAFGSIGTVGGQNFFDIRKWNGSNPCQGSFAWWYSQFGQFYSTESMAERLTIDITKYNNVTVYYGYDIYNYTRLLNPYRITRVYIKKISRNSSTGFIQWGSTSVSVTGSVFIDASDDGRLVRLANFGGTVGRYDWPANKLDQGEKGFTGKPRQQAATLMFQVKNVNINGQNIYADMNWSECTLPTDPTKKVYGVYGGKTTYKQNVVIKNFNNLANNTGFAIKPINAAQDGPNSPNWWVNALLIFNVDGRACERDRNTSNFPSDMRSDYITVDEAWVNARNLLNQIGSGSFLEALQQFGGFSAAQIVKTGSYPKVGEVLYLRETIHMAKDSGNRGNGTGNTNYEITEDESHKAGTSHYSGSDTSNYNTRIGLNYYWSDINAYKAEDLKDENSVQYIWGDEIAYKLRDDLSSTSYPIDGNSPKNPVYIPYSALTTNYVANLLIPGYAVGASSFAWEEMRVIPNLCVLGDAAGVAAAYALNQGKYPLYLSTSDISSIQTILSSLNVKLDK